MSDKIRIGVYCPFLYDDRILVQEHEEDGERWYRPLGGEVDFGEHSLDALKRELREEIRAEMTLPEYVGTLESVWKSARGVSHQLSIIYNAKFIDPKFYSMKEIPVHENGAVYKAVWKPLSFFIQKHAPLYPEGLLELLMK